MTTGALRVAPIPDKARAAALPEVARLRIGVFRDWPYLYDGDPGYEARYLAPYAASAGAIIVGAWAGERMVGASTGAPLEDHAEAFGAPFRAGGWALEDFYYCAESVLLPDWRGHGAGRAFFAAREAKARAMGRAKTCFCAVIRPEDHPARPAGYRPLDGFWRAIGYQPVEGLVARLGWKDIGDAEETEKELQFWMRTL
ncbi:MAG: GNAT family N-acetyltransferase [Pikeienuella sp.]